METFFSLNNGFVGIAPNSPIFFCLFYGRILFGTRLLYVILGMNILYFGVVLITHLKASVLYLVFKIED